MPAVASAVVSNVASAAVLAVLSAVVSAVVPAEHHLLTKETLYQKKVSNIVPHTVGKLRL